MVFFFFLKSNNSFPSKQWKKKKWRWVRLWWERASLFLVLELLGPSFSGILPWDHSFAKFDCVAFFFPGAGVVGNPSYLLLDWLCWILFCLAYSLVTWFLLFRHESRTFQRETDSHLASQLVLHYLTVMPAVGFFLEKKRQESRTVRENGAGALVLPELWTNYPWPCSRRWIRCGV